MEVAITKMSKNGQVVIPTEIREDAHLKPATKFLVFNENGNIWLKRIDRNQLLKEARLIESLEQSERDIKEGKTKEWGDFVKEFKKKQSK